MCWMGGPTLALCEDLLACDLPAGDDVRRLQKVGHSSKDKAARSGECRRRKRGSGDRHHPKP